VQLFNTISNIYFKVIQILTMNSSVQPHQSNIKQYKVFICTEHVVFCQLDELKAAFIDSVVTSIRNRRTLCSNY